MSYHDTAIVGIIYYCTRIGASVLRTGRGRAGGGGGGGVIFNLKKNSLRNVPGVGGRKVFSLLNFIFIFRGGILGCLGRPTPPPGGRAGSENDTLLPMTMICDRLKFWSGPAWRSKVIIRKPWRRKNKKNKNKKKNSDKTIRHSHRETGNA